jgi:hypothetical protein
MVDFPPRLRYCLGLLLRPQLYLEMKNLPVSLRKNLGLAVGHNLSPGYASTPSVREMSLEFALTAKTDLQGILSTKTLFAMKARERFDSEVYPLMPFQIMVSVETLWT